MTARCSNCGQVNEDDAVFCAHCNHFLAWSVEDTPGGDAAGAAPAVADRPTPPREAPIPVPAAPVSMVPPASPPPAESPVQAANAGVPAPAPGEQLLAAIGDSATMAEDRSRPDLAERLDRARRTMQDRTVTVAVVGEFKRGKSTLVNALIQSAACPVDADIVTAVPTLVKYGDHFAVTAHAQSQDGSTETTRTAEPAELTKLVSERGDGHGPAVLSVEVDVPHRILRSGLRLLDTPGVGGLESVHGQVSLASLMSADAMLFVTDASQELTGPELDFLRSALERCPIACFVVTKTDLHHHWRQILELDRGHLSRARLDLPVVAVSSFLRLRAVRQPELNEESGFGALVEFLAKNVVQGAATQAARTVAHEVDFVTSQLAHQADAERVVLAEPEQGAAVVTRLDRASRRAQGLSAPDATWQQTLSDGIQDLVADVEHDLQGRLRTVLAGVRDLIDHTDPRTSWTDTEAWLRREVAAAAVANRTLLVARASELAESVATQFDLDAGEAVELDLDLVTKALQERHLPSAASLSMPGGRLASLVITARTSALLPMMAISAIIASPAGGLALFLLLGATTVLGGGIGSKLFRDESKRQRSYRQGQAKAAAAKFVDEVAFEINKEAKDALRRTQRQLRDEFHSRARSLHVSATGALAAARSAVELTPEAKVRRTEQLDAESARLAAIRASLRQVSEAGTAGRVGVGRG